jgi:hypothetical protein
MGFTQKTINRFEMIHRMAAAEIPAAHAGHRAFVGIYPPSPQRNSRVAAPLPQRNTQWMVLRFEIPNELMDEFFRQEEIMDFQRLFFDNLEEVEKSLNKWGLNPADFDAPWKCDYPL